MCRRARCGDHAIDELALVEALVVEARAERALAVAGERAVECVFLEHQAIRDDDDRRRVDATGEARTDRYIRTQPDPHSVLEQFVKTLDRARFGVGATRE